MDSVYPYILFVGSTTGKIAIYNAKRMTKKLCAPLDVFSIHDNSAISISTTKGHLLISSPDGLHVYNTSFSQKYVQPHLSLMRKYEDDFDNLIANKNDDNDNDNVHVNGAVLIDSFTDVNGKTIVAYGVSDRMVVLDSNLPVYDEKDASGGGGWTTILSKAPLYVILVKYLLL